MMGMAMKIRKKSLTAQFIKDTFSYYPQTRCEYIALLALSIALIPWSLPVILLDRFARGGDKPGLPGVFGLCLALILVLLTYGSIGGTTTFWIALLLASLIVPIGLSIAGACVLLPTYLIIRVVEWRKNKRVDDFSNVVRPGDLLIVDGKEMIVTKRNSGTVIAINSGQTVFIRQMRWARRSWRRKMRWARRSCRALKRRACAKIEYVEDQ